MDFQNRAGSKPGSAGVAGSSESNVDRRERLRKLALETIDLSKDPYLLKNHLGSYECKLCLTLHNNEGSYLAHTQGKKHQTNLARRAARDTQEGTNTLLAGRITDPNAPKIQPKKIAVKIGRPGYNVIKIRDPVTKQLGLLFQIQYPEVSEGIKPRHRFMSAFEQRIEAPMKQYQYLLFAAEPYETIAFKVPSKEIDRGEGRFWTHWEKDAGQFTLQFYFKTDRGPSAMVGAPGVGPAQPVMNSERAAMIAGMPPMGNPLNPYAQPPPPQMYAR